MLNKKGLTIAEAVISMVLLAVITVGIYGVIMASVRSGRKPDIKEEMAYAIEQASAKFKALVQNDMFCIKWDSNDQCLLVDGCLVYDAAGTTCTTPVPGVPNNGGVYACSATDSACLDLIRKAKNSKDICGIPLSNNPIVTSYTGEILSVDNPFKTGDVNYHITCVDLPPSCTSFYYNVIDMGVISGGGSYNEKRRYNVQFHIDCNG
ncbi:MAG: hypothetical protein LBI01_06605 [Elusimicrobium sp.]|jgi:hypothetical protein|nr:hypothetical protein [Elusimicrobium sp.]